MIMTHVKILHAAKTDLENRGLFPIRIFLSMSVHNSVVFELSPGAKNKILTHIFNVPVTIDGNCPAGAGYIEGIK